MSQLKLITLDLDNTLWDVERIIRRAEADMLKWMAAQVPESVALYRSPALEKIRAQVMQRQPQRQHDLSHLRTEILFAVMQACGLSTAAARRQAEQAFAVFFEARNRVEFFPGALTMLQNLTAQYPVYALTNGNADIHRAGLGHLLSGAFSSADVGAKKPHRDMFQAPLNALQVAPHETVHIGDHLLDDVFGANAAGLHTVWVNLTDQQRSPTDSEPSQEVRHLQDVVPAIGAIQQRLSDEH